MKLVAWVLSIILLALLVAVSFALCRPYYGSLEKACFESSLTLTKCENILRSKLNVIQE